MWIEQQDGAARSVGVDPKETHRVPQPLRFFLHGALDVVPQVCAPGLVGIRDAERRQALPAAVQTGMACPSERLTP
jgi:hypothetical protein